MLSAVDQVLCQSRRADVDTTVPFARSQDLRVFNVGIKLEELRRSWSHFALTLEPASPPLPAIQIQIAPSEWLYIAFFARILH